MKKWFIAVLASVVRAQEDEQVDSVVIRAIDSKGNKDSVLFGFRNEATLGIDEQFGEEDFSQKPITDLDLRLIQRTIITYGDSINCAEADSFWLSGVKSFQQNIDLKSDFRKDGFYKNNRSFVLQINAINFPVVLEIAKVKMEKDIPFTIYNKGFISESLYNGELLNLLRNGCSVIDTIKKLQPNFLVVFSPQMLDDTHIDENSSKKIEISEYCSFSVSPNPATNIAEFVFTLLRFSTDYSLEILDMQSKLVQQVPVTLPYLKVDISPLEPGVYICNLKQSVQILETKKLIKK